MPDSKSPFDASHLVAFLMGVTLVVLMGRLAGPLAMLSAPLDVRQITAKLHSIRLAVKADSIKDASWLQHDAMRDAHILALHDSTTKYQRASRGYASANRRLLDSLRLAAGQRGDTATEAALGAVASNVIASDSACQLAVSSCEMAKDSLRHAVSDRDSILAVRRAERDSAVSLSGQSVGVAQREHRTLTLTRLGLAASLLLTVLATVK